MGEENSKKLQVNILGWYGHQNIGDESYKLSFPIVFPDYDFVFSDKVIDPSLPHVLGGGDIVCDAFLNSLKSVQRKSIISAAISKPTKNIVGFQNIAVRDMFSVSNAAASGLMANYVPDFGFALSPNKERGLGLIKEQFVGLELYTKTVCVIINGHLTPQHGGTYKDGLNFEYFSQQLSRVCDSTPASFIFIPFGRHLPWDDRVANSWVASKCKFYKKNKIVYEGLSVADTIDIVAACDAMISTRLHSSIFGCVAGTPFMDVTHNHKNKAFLETIGLIKLSIPYDDATYERMFTKLRSLLTDSAEIKNELCKITSKQKQILSEFSKNVSLT